jgi:hypothetical protein
VRDDLSSFAERVRAEGWASNRYALVASFVLDGLVWEALEQQQAIESADASTIPSGSEYWSGVSWITLPPHPIKLGTNSHGSDAGTLYATWTPTALEVQKELRRSGLREELVAVAFGQPPAHKEHWSRMEGLGLVRDGAIRIPAIDVDSALCRQGGELAELVAESLMIDEALDEILEKTGARDNSVAMIMGYHWIYPALLGLLGTEGLRQPSLLAGGPEGQLAPTLFAVAPGTRCVARDG